MSAPSLRRRVWQSFRHQQPDCIPWTFGYTLPARTLLETHFGLAPGDPAIDSILGNHIVRYKTRLPHVPIGNNQVRDEWGVVLDQTTDKDIGSPFGQVLPTRCLDNLRGMGKA